MNIEKLTLDVTLHVIFIFLSTQLKIYRKIEEIFVVLIFCAKNIFILTGTEVKMFLPITCFFSCHEKNVAYDTRDVSRSFLRRLLEA